MAKEKSEKPGRVNIASKFNEINFKNSQIPFITNLQEEKSTRRGNNRTQSKTRIQGLQTLKNTLGRQFMKKESDY
jgi:hypothetical protein